MAAPLTARRRWAAALVGALAALTPLSLLSPVAAAAGERRVPVTTTSGAPGVPGTPGTATSRSTARPIPTGAAAAGAPATCSAANLAAVQGYVSQALSGRVAQLNSLSAAVGAAADLTAADRSTLASDLASELAGIQALQAQLPSATTCQAVVAAGRAMVVNFRVYVVMTPQAHLTIAADTETTVAANLAALEPRLKAAVTSAGQSGTGVATAQRDLGDLEAEVAAAQRSSAGISAQVLGFTPASYPASWSVLRSDRVTLGAGERALRRADLDLHQIVAVVR
ncbi:MAG: hypothetical protein ACLP9C_02035 [Acidimicrobiales bacterium]